MFFWKIYYPIFHQNYFWQKLICKGDLVKSFIVLILALDYLKDEKAKNLNNIFLWIQQVVFKKNPVDFLHQHFNPQLYTLRSFSNNCIIFLVSWISKRTAGMCDKERYLSFQKHFFAKSFVIFFQSSCHIAN